MSARRFSADVYSGVKAATRLFVDEAFGGQKVAAGATRVDQQAISAYGSTAPDRAERFMPVDVLLDLIKASGDTRLLKHLAETVNCILVPLPEGLPAGEVAERMGKSATEFGDVMVRVGAALRDGRICPAEGRTIAHEIREAMLELSALAEAVKAATVVEDEP